MENTVLSDRGFLGGKFTDNYGKPCSIQESSACSSNGDEGWYIWLGLDEVEIHKDLRSGPGTRVYLDNSHDIFSRMHLSQKKVGELLPHLMYFAATGSLPNAEQYAKFDEHLTANVQPVINGFFDEINT